MNENVHFNSRFVTCCTVYYRCTTLHTISPDHCVNIRLERRFFFLSFFVLSFLLFCHFSYSVGFVIRVVRLTSFLRQCWCFSFNLSSLSQRVLHIRGISMLRYLRDNYRSKHSDDEKKSVQKDKANTNEWQCKKEAMLKTKITIITNNEENKRWWYRGIITIKWKCISCANECKAMLKKMRNAMRNRSALEIGKEHRFFAIYRSRKLGFLEFLLYAWNDYIFRECSCALDRVLSQRNSCSVSLFLIIVFSVNVLNGSSEMRGECARVCTNSTWTLIDAF